LLALSHMIRVHFHAQFQPNHRRFILWVKVGNQARIHDYITISQFIKRFLKVTTDPIVVKGVTVKFLGDDGSAERKIREYLQKAAQSYVAAKWGKGQDN